jgi:ribosomal protein S12 methylthiotransferase
MAVQQPIAFAFNETQVGQVREVLIDGPATDQPGVWVGRTYADAPDVDGQVLVSGAELEAGDLVSCEILAAEGYDLIGRAGSVPPRHRKRRPRPRTRPASPFPILG